MDDFQLILSIIFGVLYFLYQALSGKRKRKGQQQQNDDTESPQGKSFEDFLREISGEPIEVEEEPEVQQRPVRNKNPQTKTSTVSSQTQQSAEDDSYASYEGVVDKPKKLVKLDDQVDFDDAGSLLKKVEELEADEEVNDNHPILKMLQTQESARNAIIMGEIFNRKSF